MTRPKPVLAVKDLLDVASQWAHDDDWSVPSIYIDTLEEIAEALAAGDEPGALACHGKHVAQDCVRRACADRIPHTMAKDARRWALLTGGDR